MTVVSSELVNNQEQHQAKFQRARRMFRFMATKNIATINWLSGAIGGNYLAEKQGLNPWLVGAGIATVTFMIDYPQSRYMVSKIGETSTNKKPEMSFYEQIREKRSQRAVRHVRRGANETVALLVASNQGSGANTEYNNTAGLDNTPRRNKAQAAAFAVGVGLYSTPVPIYDQLSDGAQSAIDSFIEHPVQGTLYAAAGSVVFYGGMYAVNSYKAHRAAEQA